MLTYGQRMELELQAKVMKKAREEARQEVTKEITEQVTKEITEQVTKEVTQQVTKEVTQQVTKEVTQQTQRDVLLRQLTRRFGGLPADTVERIQQADTHELEQWIDRILDAASLQDVFAEQRG
jgi:hypothetical protein